MKNRCFAPVLPVILSLAMAGPVRADSCAAGEPVKATSITFASLEGTAALIGFPEFASPSSPPRKYRRRDITGTMNLGNWSGSSCPPATGTTTAQVTGSVTGGSGTVYTATIEFQQYELDGNAAFLVTDVSPNPEWAGVAFGPTSTTTGGIVRTGPGDYTLTLHVHAANGDFGYVNTQVPFTVAPSILQTRDEWNITQAIRADGTGEPDTNTSKRYRSRAGGFPNNESETEVAPPPGFFASSGPSYGTGTTGGDLTTDETTQTSRRTRGTGLCMPQPPNSFMYVGEVVERLTEEDTVNDAERRAMASPGSSRTAYRTSRGNGFTWSFCQVNYEATFNVACAGEYDAVITSSTKPHGAPAATGRDVQIIRKTLQPGDHKVTGEIRVNQTDTDYTVESIELRRPCDAVPPGAADYGLDSVHVELSLGLGSRQESAGFLSLEAEVITASLYSPAALTVATPDLGVETVHDDSGILRQVKAPQALADIVTLNSSAYEVRFYAPNDVGAQDPGTKLYAVSGTPYVTYKFENPDTGVTERLKIAETRGANVKESLYTYAAGTSTWSLSTGNGLRQENLVIATAGADTTKITTISDGSTVVSKVAKTYRTYAWGEELISEVLDPDGAALTTSYDFYDNSGTDGGNYGRLKLRTNPNGSWERFTYDSSGRTLKTIRPFLNAVATAAENLCRVAENVYTTLPDADGDGLVEQLTTTIENTLGTETGRSYRLKWSKPVALGGESFDRVHDIRCVTAGAAYAAAGNLVTETLAYTADPLSGRVRRVLKPDGTATLAAYAIEAGGAQTAVVATGAPNASMDDIIDGTRTTIFTSAQGQVTGESTSDIASGLVLASWTATGFDALGRPTRLDHADGTYETRDYACCGLSSSRDRSGAVTSYQYDALGRQTHVKHAGLTTRTAYDAVGRVKTVTRIGSDSSEMVQETNAYDLAGRLTERKDALNRPTGYAEVHDDDTGHTTRTTTNPDSGTRIEVTARDGSLLSVAGTAAAPRTYEYDLESGVLFTRETLVGPAGATTEWIKSFTDFAGRTHKTVYADNATAQSCFNGIGQLVRQVDPDGVTTLFAYNARGEQEVTALDLDADNTIDYDGPDRITKTVTSVTTNGSHTVQRSTTSVWEPVGQDTPVAVSLSEQSTDGLRSWQRVRGQLTSSVTVPDGSGGRTVTTTGPDGVKSIQVYASDRLASATVSTAADGQLAAVTYGYDEHGRLKTATDARNGATTYSYFADDQFHTVTTPDPDATRSGPGYDPQTTTYHYDNAGRPDLVTLPDATVVNTTYWPTGATKRTWGSRTYPTEYTYDPQGRVKTLTTWQDFATAAGAAVTTWNYNAQRGWLDNKRHNDNTGPAYTYKPSGRLQTRVWARTPSITTTYGYNAAGDLEGIDYSDSTPDVSMTHDRLGRPKTITDGSGSRALSYDTTGPLKDEDYTAGLLNTLGVHRTFDSLSRLESLAALSASSVLNQMSFGYDATSRLDTVTSGTNTATYSYVPNSPLIGAVVFRQAGATRLTTTKSYDNLNRLVSIASIPAASAAVSAAYVYNAANQRTKATREDSAYWDYGYDALGQVTSGRKYDATLAPLAGHDFAWTYDDIGNRKTATSNGQTSHYSPNLLNQYDSRIIPGGFDLLAAAAPDATVTYQYPADTGVPVPLPRVGDLLYTRLTADNSTGNANAKVRITGVKNLVGLNGEDAVTEITKSAYLPQTPLSYTHDADGNLTNDGRWTYAWDGENRLMNMQTTTTAANAGVDRQKLDFAYDGQGRRVAKKVYSWDGTAWVLGTSARFLYDGWNLIAELNAMNSNASVRTYVWGLDLSGSLQGAGGVGGLLFATVHGSPSTVHCPSFDGNGNIIAYVDMATGGESATYEYNAFGETLIADGPAKDAFPFRFSTKYTDPETGLLYYGLRYYSPSIGRWISRDPAEEFADGPNLHAFMKNSPLTEVDYLGLWSVSEHYDIIGNWLDSRSSQLPKGSTYERYEWRCGVFINVKSALQQGNDMIDGTGAYFLDGFYSAQHVDNSYLHAMRAPNQSKSEARNAMYKFVFKRLRAARASAERANEFYKVGNKSAAQSAITSAVVIIGQAQHPIADNTSPQHYDFQIWRGMLSLSAISEARKHHKSENRAEYEDQPQQPFIAVKGFFDPSLSEILK
jgi:RHS repeat-associated protein